MSNCLWCDVEIVKDVTWGNLFSPGYESRLCDVCEGKLTLYTGVNRCKKCSRFSTKSVCSDCLWWEKRSDLDVLSFNHSIYTYSEQMKDLISRWKYRGDYVLAGAFERQFVENFNHVFPFARKDVVAVAIPLSEERLKTRGFNQAEVLADFLPIKRMCALKRIHNEKQAKKTREERIHSKNPFILKQAINKSVILVDDIYTTGTTLRHAAQVLKQSGSKDIFAYTLIRG